MDYEEAKFAIPIVSRRVADYLSDIAPDDIQRVPAVLPGDPGEWELLNVLTCIDCIDHSRSTIQYYPPDHPSKPGKPRTVIWLVLEESKIRGRHIFRPKGWEVKLIVSETIKDGLQALGATGLEFHRIPTEPLKIPPTAPGKRSWLES